MSNAHEASASATGYLYQCRYALLMGLEATLDSPELRISIEKFDDIAFESNGQPVHLIQTKHHKVRTGKLTDASADLWKTLLIWIKNAQSNGGVFSKFRHLLITTGVAPSNSAAFLLRMKDRDEAEADALLLKVATTSTNSALSKAFSAYACLPMDSRHALLKSLHVLDGSASITDVKEDIHRQLHRAVGRQQIEIFAERLEGWWFDQVISMLSAQGEDSLPVLAIESRIDELREEFRRASLPVDYRASSPPEEIIPLLSSHPFVHQLRKINLGSARIEYAIRDYYRASEQRSKWVREELLVNDELKTFEQVLVEAWQPRFAAQQDDLLADSNENDRIRSGRELFKWAEQQACFPLRSLREQFLTHGSYHILANRYAVGWHPDYMQDRYDEQKGND
ncbi:ABC-three component system protein [Pantoea agglomerans]|uniref:ABC-three component system protein n=1 Tax=Enterobacter agglomerans TaxID=549 RepID=UPI001654AF3E|nr:ABC-three component system protein [Pantoea agglomerans]